MGPRASGGEIPAEKLSMSEPEMGLGRRCGAAIEMRRDDGGAAIGIVVVCSTVRRWTVGVAVVAMTMLRVDE
jgi:hypothetical protein